MSLSLIFVNGNRVPNIQNPFHEHLIQDITVNGWAWQRSFSHLTVKQTAHQFVSRKATPRTAENQNNCGKKNCCLIITVFAIIINIVNVECSSFTQNYHPPLWQRRQSNKKFTCLQKHCVFSVSTYYRRCVFRFRNGEKKKKQQEKTHSTERSVALGVYFVILRQMCERNGYRRIEAKRKTKTKAMANGYTNSPTLLFT